MPAKRQPVSGERPQARAAGGALAKYNEKRNFQRTAEPAGDSARRPTRAPARLSFVVQKHWASRLHYDFRLELDGVLLSWAVPKGPSFDPAEKRMAVQVEDHPLDYAAFEGEIPKGNYGAGTVIVWDNGWWEPVGDPHEGMAKGKLVFTLHGQKLAGLWELVRIPKPDDKQDQWMLFKKRDAWARTNSQYDIVAALPDSVTAHPLGLKEEREGPDGSPLTPTASTEVGVSAAPNAPLPRTLAPQLATLVDQPPAGDWEVENKFDGYRMLARVEEGRARLFTRNGHDWTSKLPKLQQALEALTLPPAWIDGEIVVLNVQGVPDFNALQNAIDGGRNSEIVYFAFDLPYADGRDLRRVPLRARRDRLAQLLQNAPELVRFSEGFNVPPAQMLAAACAMRLEGLMLKRKDAPYVSGRTETWLKLKCQQRQEFVVVGFTGRVRGKDEVGGLLLGYHENGRLRYAGSVGTGWDAKTARALRRRLDAIEVKEPPLDPETVKPGRWSKRPAGVEHWVRPELVVEVAFSEWTPNGHIRHPSFRGIREDKPASAITREAAAHAVPASSVKVTHGDRVIDPKTGLRKIDLVRYYESIAEWMMPYLSGRPVSLVRAPEGITGQLFFQKHPETKMPRLKELDPKLWPGHAALLAVDSPEALVAAAQMNVIEFHGWNSTVEHIDQPSQFVLDLDPGEGVSWKAIQEAALLLRSFLQELGLQSWVKTSGGKGLHVFVPIRPQHNYDVVKGFSQAIVQHIARAIPQRFVSKSGGSNRVGKIFIVSVQPCHLD
jgi:bifunctional non-homologous end joining protein LigD